MDVDKAFQTQLANIEKKTGKTRDELFAVVLGLPDKKHGELVAMLKADYGMGHGDANTIVHFARKSDGASAAATTGASTDDVLSEIYKGPKEALRPIHDAVMRHIEGLGEFEIAPKKGYVSLRRKKQFAMLGPGSNSRVDLGLNMKGVEGTDRLDARPAGEMCQYKVKLSDVSEVDAELVSWIRTAFESAG